uniref:Uncharacterized protein n=1 Tax=Chlamydomonas leiostraca TaxID=1034604 RepID=A0A7S0R2X2_9CHLO
MVKMLGVSDWTAKNLLKQKLTKLCITSEEGGAGKFAIDSLVQDTVRLLMEDYAILEPSKIVQAAVVAAQKQREQVRLRFCQHVVENVLSIAWNSYPADPKGSYGKVKLEKDNIEQALLFLQQASDKTAIRPLVLAALSCTTYFAAALEPQLVQNCCRFFVAEWAGHDHVASGTCKAVQAIFWIDDKKDEKYGCSPSLKAAKEAIALLADHVEDEEVLLLRAAALRTMGAIERSINAYKSLPPLKSALALLKGVGCPQDIQPDDLSLEDLADKKSMHLKLEYGQILAELSGALDYLPDLEKLPDDPTPAETYKTLGMQFGSHAVSYLQGLTCKGLSEHHPTIALSYEAWGYNLRSLAAIKKSPPKQDGVQVEPSTNDLDQAKIWLEQARDNHNTALKYREHVFGMRHTATALSINQMGLCKQDMGLLHLMLAQREPEQAEQLKQEAEKMMLEAERDIELSLDIRRECKGPKDTLVANTYWNLSQLRLHMANLLGQLGQRVRALEDMRQVLTIRRIREKVGSDKLTKPLDTLAIELGKLSEHQVQQEAGRIEELHRYVAKMKTSV